MALTASFSNAMSIGQGFNTYTQELRLNGAVKVLLGQPKNSTEPNGGSTSAIESASQSPTPNGHAQGKEPTAANGVLDVPAIPDPTTFNNAQMVAGAQAALYNPSTLTGENSPFNLSNDPAPCSSQSVTYSTRAIDNMSDIMDALNISASMSIKYGTIHGNGSAAFVNENKVLDSQLNYIVSVKVNNNTHVVPEEMIFQPIEGLPAERFTEVFGDCFISGFTEGGDFNAIISVDVHDKSKLRHIKQSIDVQLATGPTPLHIGGKESIDKSHSEVLQDTEITISVNWVGGGEIKKPEVPWTIDSVLAVANAFPSMVARCSAKTSAILTRYNSLRSFEEWRYKKASENQLWADKSLILNYSPCSIYTQDLFDAFLAYKKLWKRIDYIMSDMTRWKKREKAKVEEDLQKVPIVAKHDFVISPQTGPNTPDTPVGNKENVTLRQKSPQRIETFAVENQFVQPSFDLKAENANREPIPLDPFELNEARLLCREAMTLITEEAARLVNHPDLAYADFDEKTGLTKMKRPNYAYPEILKARLPVYVRNDAADNSFIRDAAAVKLQMHAQNNDLFAHLIGDAANPYRKYKPFVSLDLNETHGHGNALCGLSLHAYHHHHMSPSRFSKDSHNAIGGIGFRFASDKEVKPDGCSQYEGKARYDDSSMYKKLDLSSKSKALELPPLDITKIEIYYVPGSGRIAGIVFYDSFGPTPSQLSWKQWTSTGREPANLIKHIQEPPGELGATWKFVGLMGDWDDSIWGPVLSRVSGIWRRV